VGADPPGELILRELRAEQVQAITATDTSPTGLMVRWRPSGAHGRVTYYRRHSAGSHLCTDDIPADVVRGAAVLHVTGITLALGPGPAEAIARAVDVARDAGVTVSFDLNFRSALWSHDEAAPALEAAVRRADVVFAGETEAEIITRTADPLQAALALEAFGAPQVVIKRGALGCLARVDGVTIEQPAPAVPVVDTVGAGDACVAGYLAELMGGAEPAVRLRTAAAAGAFAVTVSGDWEGMPDRPSLQLLEASEPVVR
jgi:2-dehydro-3-deoxygluconokinase